MCACMSLFDVYAHTHSQRFDRQLAGEEPCRQAHANGAWCLVRMVWVEDESVLDCLWVCTRLGLKILHGQSHEPFPNTQHMY